MPGQLAGPNLTAQASNSSDDQKNQGSHSGELGQSGQVPTEAGGAQDQLRDKTRDKNKRAQKRFRERKRVSHANTHAASPCLHDIAANKAIVAEGIPSVQEKAQETEKYLANLLAELEQIKLETTKVEERNSLLEKVLSLNKEAPAVSTKDLFVLVRSLHMHHLRLLTLCATLCIVYAHDDAAWFCVACMYLQC